jgi:hypothetical protein
MHHRAIILSAGIFILIVIGMFVYAYLAQREQMQPTSTAAPAVEEPTVDQYAYIERIDATHFFADGMHTIVGEFTMPTPCDLLEAESFVAESFPEQIRVAFTVVNNADSCAQVLTPARFKVEASASEAATWSATFNGRPITINLIEAAPGQTPEDFDVFIKG